MPDPEEWLNSLSEAELLQLAEDGMEEIAPIERAVAAGTEGTFPCPRCSADIPWKRSGRGWSAKCCICDWDAVGALSVKSVAN